jgi:hypothetical protein
LASGMAYCLPGEMRLICQKPIYHGARTPSMSEETP